jgi:Zn-dependent M28 family amino/carboxypeptidase
VPEARARAGTRAEIRHFRRDEDRRRPDHGDFLRAQIAKISSDEFEGRGPATPGDTKARQYIVEQLQDIGFVAGGPDSTWQQTFNVVGITAEMPKQWSFSKGGKKASFKWWDQYIAGSGVQTETGSIKNAEVVFVGYGIQAPEYGWDDFKGQDLKGKVLLMLNNDPDWDPNLFAGNTRLYYGRWVYKYESAARQGAAGAIIVHTTPSAGYPFQVVQTSWSGEQVETPAESEPRIQVKAWMTEDASRQLVKLAGQDLDKLIESAKSKDFQPVPLGVTTSMDFKNKLNKSQTANVYGMLKGSDPKLADEYVIYSAHHDHLGVGEPDAKGDKIYNGAMDNASGVAQLLAIGKAYRALPTPPKRSIMLLLVAAEEQGLLGSKYYAEHPTIQPGKIVANINYDGGNIWGRTKDIIFVGKGKSTIDEYVDEIAKAAGPSRRAGSVPGPRLLLSLRPVQLREDRRARAVPRRRHRVRRQAAGVGQGSARGVREEALSPAVGRDPGQLELRRHDRGRAARVLRRRERRERGAAPGVGAGR